VQALLLISYREIGVGAMSSAWMNCGMGALEPLRLLASSPERFR